MCINVKNGRDVTRTSHTSRLSTRFEICFFIKSQKMIFHSTTVCFSWLLGCEGSGAIFVVCACAVGLRGNRLTGMRGTWGVVWRSAHVPTIPFTWLRRAIAWAPTAHASNYQALLSIKLCEQCGSNSCVRVFFMVTWFSMPIYGHVWRQWGHMVQMRDSDWSREFLLRSDWLLIIGATFTTINFSSLVLFSFLVNSLVAYVLCCMCFFLYS